MIKSVIKQSRVNYSKLIMFEGILLLSLGLLFPYFSHLVWFSTITKIRDAINTGDSGHLILASATINSLYAIQSTLLFMGVMLTIFHSKLKNWLNRVDILLISLITIILLQWANAKAFDLPWEPISTILALIISLYLFERLFGETNSFIQVFIVSIQVFFAFHWLNIMPLFSTYRFGQSDIPYSIKTAGIYLRAATVLNFTGFSFFIPFIISAFITATLFISYSQNIHIMRDNYEKESELRNMRSKALEDRVYQEVNSLVHDLKTPLVTIRGLNSLMLSYNGNGNGKIEEYSERIENSVLRMSEMISSFLYETSRQKLKAEELISYIRAQLPLEDERIKFEFILGDNLPDLYINKIRIARAVINILENAIVVPCKHTYKLINVEVKSVERGIDIIVRDNGIGIKDSDISLIWDVGYSTNKTSGLGLPFAKRIFEDNGGKIKIESLVDMGATVIIFLPSADYVEES